MRPLRRVSLACTLLLGTVVGCATYRPDPLDAGQEMADLRAVRPEALVVIRARPGEGPASDPAFDPADGFSEPEVVSVALTLNPELRARRAELGEARASLITAGLWPNPEVGVGWRRGIGGASGTFVEADALFQLLRPGERDARRRAADARVEQVSAEVVADELRVVGEAREQRLEVLAAERAVALLREAMALRERALGFVRERRRLGEGTELDVSATELELAEARRDVRKAETHLEAQLRRLNTVLGLPPDHTLKLTGFGEPLEVTVFDDLDDEALDQRIVAVRPELRAKEAQHRGAEQALRLAVLGQFPRLGLGPAFERELGGDSSLGLGLTIELPLFDRNQGEIAEKLAVRQQRRAEYAALLHKLRAEAFDARAAVRRARLEVEAQEREILPLVQRNQELFEGAFRARELNIIDWITAQQRAVNARVEYLEALVRYRQAVIRLESAIGQPLSRPMTAPATAPATRPN